MTRTARRARVCSLSIALMGFAASPAAAATISTPVDLAFIPASAGIGEYDFASVSVFVDPALTSWIAWNAAPTVSTVNAGCSAFIGGAAGSCLGPGGFGTDDFIRITVVNPLLVSLSVDLDQNTAFGNSFGPQNVIFGTAAAAPDVLRTSPPFGSPPSVTTVFNEAGPFGAIFTTAGVYRFDFSFRNAFSSGAGHQNIFLLAEVAPPASVPEPATVGLLAAGLIAVARRRRRRAD